MAIGAVVLFACYLHVTGELLLKRSLVEKIQRHRRLVNIVKNIVVLGLLIAALQFAPESSMYVFVGIIVGILGGMFCGMCLVEKTPAR